MHNVFRVLRYLFIFLPFTIYPSANALERRVTAETIWNVYEGDLSSQKCSLRYNDNVKEQQLSKLKSHAVSPWPYIVQIVDADKFFYGNNICGVEGYIILSDIEPPKDPCETPKTDEQCNKGATAWITGNASFWATATSPDGYKGCMLSVLPGTAVIQENGDRGQDAVSTGSTGKSWCAPDPSEPPTPENELGNNSNFKPAPDNNPKNCPAGWVKTKTGQYYCLATGTEFSPPSDRPDGSINSDKDGNPSPPDSNVGKPPINGDGGGDGGGTGGGDGGDGGGTGGGDGGDGGGGSGGGGQVGELRTEPDKGLTSFWEKKYEKGMAGVWQEKSAELDKTGIFRFLNQFQFGSGGGGNISFGQFCFNFGALGSLGCHSIEFDSRVIPFIGVIMLVSAAFASRKIVFGG